MSVSSNHHRGSIQRSKPFYGRFKSTRTRSGCLCCRQRKVKCDESKPHCKRCSDARRPCVYGLKLTWPEQRPLVAEGLRGTDGIPGRKYEGQTETLFLNTTWSDFELCQTQGVPANKRGSAYHQNSLTPPIETDWSGTFQLPPSITYPRLDLTPTEMPIFEFYANRMCPDCRLVDGDRNRYRQVIIPISLVSPLVLRSVLALAANQLKHYDNKYEVTALHYQSAALQSLSKTIAFVSGVNQGRQSAKSSQTALSKTEILAIVLMLCHSEFSNEIAYRPRLAPAWHAHLDGARRILELPTPGLNAEGAGVVTFLAGFLASHSVLAYTTIVNPDDAEILFRGATYWLGKIARPPQEIDNYTNCSTELLAIILEVCHRFRQRKDCNALCKCSALRAWKHETQNRLLRIVQVHASIQTSSSPVSIAPSSNPITEYPPPVTTVNRTAEAFRHAALILLQYLDTDYSLGNNPIVHRSITIILSLMNTGVPIPPPGKSGRSVFLWPYFIAACHVQSEDDRTVVLRNLEQLEGIAMTVYNNAVSFVRHVIEGVWKQRDLRGGQTRTGGHLNGGNCLCSRSKNARGGNDARHEPDFEWETVMRSLGYSFDWA